MPGVLPIRTGSALRRRLRYWGYDDLDRLELNFDRSRLEPRPRDVDSQLFDETPVASGKVSQAQREVSKQ